jgi:hypothetical protein
MHQMQGPSGACIKDIKAFNALTSDDQQTISGTAAFLLVVSDCFPYICAIVISASLSFFLIQEKPGSFSDPRYVMANALLPLMIGSHFVYKDKESCLTDDQSATIQTETRTRSLPVVAVFHVVVTVCYWFIDYQTQQQARNIRMVEGLQSDLDEAKKTSNDSSGREDGKKKK